VTVDAVGCESHFIDHLAPVWTALPERARGVFHIGHPPGHPDPIAAQAALMERASAYGIQPQAIELDGMRADDSRDIRVHDGIPTLVASIGDIKVARRLGRGPFAFLEHGAGQAYQSRNPTMASYAGGPGREDNELFLCPNHYSGDLWRKAYPDARVEVVGSPRLDGLPQRAITPARKPVVAISFHGEWPGATVPYSGNAVTDFLPALPELARRFTVIGHAHPGKGWGERMGRIFKQHGIPFVADFADVCRQADVYVCDNSSTIFEFASTGRPVVLMNARHWHRGGGPGLRFWDAAHVGPNADGADQLIPAIERALEHRLDDIAAREDALEFVYAYRYGAATRAATAVMSWIDSRQAVAA
jgi:hypothetical protein